MSLWQDIQCMLGEKCLRSFQKKSGPSSFWATTSTTGRAFQDNWTQRCTVLGSLDLLWKPWDATMSSNCTRRKMLMPNWTSKVWSDQRTLAGMFFNRFSSSPFLVSYGPTVESLPFICTFFSRQVELRAIIAYRVRSRCLKCHMFHAMMMKWCMLPIFFHKKKSSHFNRCTKVSWIPSIQWKSLSTWLTFPKNIDSLWVHPTIPANRSTPRQCSACQGPARVISFVPGKLRVKRTRLVKREKNSPLLLIQMCTYMYNYVYIYISSHNMWIFK